VWAQSKVQGRECMVCTSCRHRSSNSSGTAMQITWDIKAKKVFFVFSFSPLSPPFSPKERRIYEKVVLYQRERGRENDCLSLSPSSPTTSVHTMSTTTINKRLPLNMEEAPLFSSSPLPPLSLSDPKILKV